MIPEQSHGSGESERWLRLAEWLRERIAFDQVDGIWVFRVVRRDLAEYGTAVLSLVEGDRRRILTASYVATIKGRERGGFEAVVEEVGSGPLEALHELLELVPIRADDEDPPASVSPTRWFPEYSEIESVPEPDNELEVVAEPQSSEAGVGDGRA